MLCFLKWLTMSVVITAVLSVLFILLSMKPKSDREKYSVFECGFDLLSMLRLPFSLNFYFITIIFLIFDVELVLILPFMFNLKFSLSLFSLTLLTLFFLILIVGFLYEWLAGLLNWFV